VPPRNRWHPCLLPDNYQRKLRQDLAEADSAADTRRDPDDYCEMHDDG
jgi:hypothetical protein